MRKLLPGRVLFFAAAFLFALIALLPMRLTVEWLNLPGRGFAAREARGSVWLGAFSEAQFGGAPLGGVTAELETLPLLLGRARVSLRRDEEGEGFEGAATVSRAGFGFEDVTVRLPVGTVFGPLPVSSLEFTDATVHFADGLCASAEGRVRADLAGTAGGLALSSGLSGNARCDQGALLLPLASQSGMEQMNLRLFANGRYSAELFVRPVDDTARDRLIASGFRFGQGGYAISAEGRF